MRTISNPPQWPYNMDYCQYKKLQDDGIAEKQIDKIDSLLSDIAKPITNQLIAQTKNMVLKNKLSPPPLNQSMHKSIDSKELKDKFLLITENLIDKQFNCYNREDLKIISENMKIICEYNL